MESSKWMEGRAVRQNTSQLRKSRQGASIFSGNGTRFKRDLERFTSYFPRPSKEF